MMRLFAIWLLAAGAFAQPQALPRTVRQGSVLRVKAAAGAASARMNGRTIRLFAQADGSAFGLMPVPVLEKPGAYTVELLDASGAAISTSSVTVVDARFRRQNVTVSQGVAELKPAPGEMETVAAFRGTVSEVRHWSEPLALPVPGCQTSPFGVLRYLNGKPTGNFHGGIDQRGAAGTPIRAAAAGVVKIAQDWKIHGRTVGVDHGQGLVSIYLHMSKIAVAEGVEVKKGDVIGFVGSTGRSNAPHLHWSIYANGLPVTPLDWIKVAPCSPRK